MNKNDWEQSYINHLISAYGFNSVFAQETYNAGMETHDYDESPEEAADEEMSYWGD